jgi:hypothetical protein
MMIKIMEIILLNINLKLNNNKRIIYITTKIIGLLAKLRNPLINAWNLLKLMMIRCLKIIFNINIRNLKIVLELIYNYRNLLYIHLSIIKFIGLLILNYFKKDNFHLICIFEINKIN